MNCEFGKKVIRQIMNLAKKVIRQAEFWTNCEFDQL